MIALAQIFLAAASDVEVIKLDRALIYIGVVQTFIFTLQLIVFWYQARKLHQTVKAAAEQTGDMKRSIGEATRAANAMEKFAESGNSSAKTAAELLASQKDTMTRLLRAYLCVNFGKAFFQKPDNSLKFEARLQLINAGQTPGYKVGYRARTAILPFPLPQDFDFSLPDTPTGGESTLGHGQQMILSGVVDRYYSETELAEINSGSKRLYMFGTATYEDVYRISRRTKPDDLLQLRLREPY
jgi:hypothetical protein